MRAPRAASRRPHVFEKCVDRALVDRARGDLDVARPGHDEPRGIGVDEAQVLEQVKPIDFGPSAKVVRIASTGAPQRVERSRGTVAVSTTS